jgi:tryptophan synthase beta chain
MRLAPTMSSHQILMVNLSGRGDKDMGILARELHLGGAPAENAGTSAPPPAEGR